MTCLITLAFSGVIWRLYDLQVKQGSRLAEEAARKYRHEIILPAQRGSIKDNQDKYLAHDEEVFELQTDRYHLRDVRAIIPCLAKVRGITEKELVRQMTSERIVAEFLDHVVRCLATKMAKPETEVRELLASTRPINVLLKDLDEDMAIGWKAYLGENFLKGVYVKPAVRRCYPVLDRLSLVIGAVNNDHEGAWGLEKTSESLLKGTPGSVSIERDKYGRELPLSRGKMITPVHGKDIHLTIDMRLQDAVDAALERACLVHKPTKAVVVVTDVATGSILAMSCMPNHARAAAGETNWKNFSISEPYEPGSTFKVVAFTAALDQRRIGPDESFNCEGGSYTDPYTKVTIRDDETLGMETARSIFAHSSNIGTYKIFKRVGKESFLKYVRDFGFGQVTGIPLTGERGGYVNYNSWSNPTASRFPIGYEVSTTPLQVAMAYGALANGGTLLKPRLIERIVSADGSETKIIEPEPVRQVCTARTAGILREMLEKVVVEGTGKRAQLESIRVAGKTGTSRRYDPDKITGYDKNGKPRLGGYAEGQYVTSFAGFAPADNPKIACVVVLDNPKASSEKELRGGKVAAPVFAEVVQETLEILSLRSSKTLAFKGGEP